MRSVLKALALTLPLALSAVAAHASLNVGDQAPCVELVNIAANGSEANYCIRTPKVPGQAKILEFFSATCSDCAQSLPVLSQLATRVDAVATTRLVGIDRSEALLRDYIKANAALIHFDVALDTNRDAKRAYDIFETPTIFVLDANDKVLYRHEGVLTKAEAQQIETLVGTP